MKQVVRTEHGLQSCLQRVLPRRPCQPPISLEGHMGGGVEAVH